MAIEPTDDGTCDPVLRCSECGEAREAGYGWQCLCRSIPCSHVLQCPDCGQSRYACEREQHQSIDLTVDRFTYPGRYREAMAAYRKRESQ